MSKVKTIRLSPCMEDYLEATAILKEINGVVRVRDISRRLNVKTPSVNAALNCLAKSGLVIHERYGYVELTEEGRCLAQVIKKRHDMLVKFLVDILMIDSRIAEQDACKMEHSISVETSKKLSKFIEFVDICYKDSRPDWLESFDHYFKTGKKQRPGRGITKRR